MERVLEKIFYEYMREEEMSNCVKEIDERLEKNKKIIGTHLNRKEKRLLLRITDDKDLITEEKSLNSFTYGFKLGVKIGYESNQK